MNCDVCGQQGARIRKISRAYGKGDNLLVIENIPLISCPNCGASYFTAETLHEIERIKANRRSIAIECPVKVAHFSELEQAS